MKANELMIGDWVFVNDVEHLRPMQVGEIKRKSGKHYACLYDPNDVSEHCECVVDKVEGIKITRKFLTKNRFVSKLCSSGNIFRHVIDNRLLEVLIFADGHIQLNIFALRSSKDGKPVLDLTLDYVHELQHVCTMCNIKTDWQL